MKTAFSEIQEGGHPLVIHRCIKERVSITSKQAPLLTKPLKLASC